MYKKCSCMNNAVSDQFENISDLQNSINMYDSCECGFSDYNEIFPSNPSFGQSYVPIQYLNTTFKPSIGLEMGTIFPELVIPYIPCQNMDDINYLNSINFQGGCNR